MRSSVLLPALALTAALLSACTQEAVPSFSQSLPSGTPDLTAGSASSFSQGSEAPLDLDLLTQSYVDVAALPVLDVSVEERVQFDDRTLTLEDSIDNELEYLVYQLYYDQAATDFDSYTNLVGETKSLQIVTQNEAENFQDGLYMTEYTLHALNTLTRDDLAQVSPYDKEDLQNKQNTFHFTEYAIVEADVSWKYSEAYLQQGPQLEEGRYLRYYLLAKTPEVPEYKWYELYWDDFLEPV